MITTLCTIQSLGFEDETTSDGAFGFADREGITINSGGNYTINTNNSDYWAGHSWNDLNNDFLMGGINISNSGTSIFTDFLDLTGAGAGIIPRLNGVGTLYDIMLLRNGVMIDFDETFPYLMLGFYDNDDDGVPENEIAFQWITGTTTLLLTDLLGGDTNLATDGNLYEQTDDRVCTAENGLCTEIETDPYWSDNFTLYNESWSSTYNSTYDAFNSSGYIINWSSVITSGDNLWDNVSSITTSNQSIDVKGDIYIKTKKTIEVDDDGTLNFYSGIE
jgi:hypothetical protein